MLVIHPEQRQRLAAAVKHARALGLLVTVGRRQGLVAVLKYLHGYANGRNADANSHLCRVTLHYDFAPHSFSIVWERRKDVHSPWQYWFNGGLIFHGPHDNGGDGSAPTFSVNLSPHHGWSVHT